MAIDRVNTGMSFDEILELGDDDSLYQTLLTDLVDKIEFDTKKNTASTFNTLIEELVNGDEDQQARAAEAICSQLDEWSLELDAKINADLDSQDARRQQLENLNIAADIDPETSNIKNSQLYGLITTPAFKDIFEAGVDS